MAVPRSELYVDPGVPEDELHPVVRRVCRAVVKEWADVEEANFSVSFITGGITNLLLKVSVEEEGVSLTAVTVRVFGPNTEAVIDRHRELQAIHHLSSAGFGASLIGLFENGMVQSFIVARTLFPPDLSDPKMVPSIAKELQRLHATKAPGPHEPQLWVDISKFMKAASAVSFDDEKKQKKYERISFVELGSEIQALKSSCDRLESPVVFSHNDLLSGNIMYNDETAEMYFIDFEYSTYNYRGYDIGNHFNEYAGFDCDFSLYPNKEAQYNFFRHYLHPDSPEKTTSTELETMYAEANAFALASHLYWGVWGIVQSRFSAIDFDYLEYFFMRYNEYKLRKTEFLSLIKAKN